MRFSRKIIVSDPKVSKNGSSATFIAKSISLNERVYVKFNVLGQKYKDNIEALSGATITISDYDLEKNNGWWKINDIKLIELKKKTSPRSKQPKVIIDNLISQKSMRDSSIETNFDDEIDEVELVLSDSDGAQRNKIKKKFNYDAIYSVELSEKVVTKSFARNKKLQDLLNKTLDDDVRATYYRTHAKTRSINYSEIAQFDDGNTEPFLLNENELLVLSAPKQLNKKISNSLLEENYSDFYTKKDYEDYKKGNLDWDDFSRKVNLKLEIRFRAIKDIVRKSKEIERETGNWAFYASWPFIEGYTTKNKIRTPFMFTPIEVEVSGGKYIFRKMDAPLKINTNLIKTVYAESRKVPIDLKIYFNSIEEIFREYAKHGIKFDNQLEELEGLKTIKKDEFDQSNQIHQYDLKNYLIFENILKSDDIFNDILRIQRDFEDLELPDPNKDVLNEEIEEYPLLPLDIDKNKNQVISDALNHSLTISGPPGTGKSEVITSILVNSISSGHTNIVVSEKDAALSVLNDRLKNKFGMDVFALKINGNGLNKAIFWPKVSMLINEIKKYTIEELPEVDDEFLSIMKKLNEYKNELDKSEIDEEDFWHDILHVSEIMGISEKNKKDITEQIHFLIKCFDDYDEILSSNEEIRAKIAEISCAETNIKNAVHENLKLLHKKLDVNFLYLPIDQVDLDFIHSLGGDHKEIFRYLSNKQFNFLNFNKYYKVNRKELIEIQSYTSKYLKSLEELENNNFEEQLNTLNEQMSEYQEQLSNLKSNFIDDIGKIKEQYYDQLKEIDVNRYQRMQDIYNNFYQESFDDTHKEYCDSSYHLKLVYSKAKKYFKNQTIIKIREKIEADNDLRKQLNSLDRISKYSIRKQKSPGTVIRMYFNLISTIFPIIIATPNEVSRYLPNDANIFDYGIFDEASQMFLERAFPTIHRSEKVIISGDQKQLGPSNFFRSNLDVTYDEDDDFLDEQGLEADSLLTWGLGRFRERLLNVHYRSKSSKLIQYSNIMFYDNKLWSIDSPSAEQNPIICENVHGKWEDRTNIIEAEKVIKTVQSNWERYESIGVITMNSDQQKMIQALAENDLIINNDINSKNPKLFIKNVENVQGDEADLIIFSLGYAPIDGKMRVGGLNFLTPNRLNVAITRSKSKMIVYKSFESSELGSGNAGTGRNNLYKWVHWLENNTSNLDSTAKNSIKNHENKFRSPFEEEFYEMLLGELPDHIIAKANYFVNGFEIDIVLYDIERESFVGAIELDGAMYHSDPEAISRDMQKTEFLESVGWNIIRVSSTSFWKDKQATVEKSAKRILVN